jgi:hypothetical protein
MAGVINDKGWSHCMLTMMTAGYADNDGWSH